MKLIGGTSSPPSPEQLEALLKAAGKALLDYQRALSSASVNLASGYDPRLGDRFLRHIALGLTELATAIEEVNWPDAIPLASAATDIYLAGALSRLLTFLTEMGSCVPRPRLACADTTSGPGS